MSFEWFSSKHPVHVRIAEEGRRASLGETSSRETALSPDSSAICMRLLRRWNWNRRECIPHSSASPLVWHTRIARGHDPANSSGPLFLAPHNPSLYVCISARHASIGLFTAITQLERTFLTDKCRGERGEDGRTSSAVRTCFSVIKGMPTERQKRARFSLFFFLFLSLILFYVKYWKSICGKSSGVALARDFDISNILNPFLLRISSGIYAVRRREDHVFSQRALSRLILTTLFKLWRARVYSFFVCYDENLFSANWNFEGKVIPAVIRRGKRSRNRKRLFI